LKLWDAEANRMLSFQEALGGSTWEEASEQAEAG
jgi:hypothetical protein